MVVVIIIHNNNSPVQLLRINMEKHLPEDLVLDQELLYLSQYNMHHSK